MGRHKTGPSQDTLERAERYIALHNAGESVKSIAQREGISKQCVWWVLKRAGYVLRYVKLEEAVKAESVEIADYKRLLEVLSE